MGNKMLATVLHKVVTEAINFACTDKTLPGINAVRLEFTEKQVLAVATDRFVLGVSRADYEGEEFTVNVSLADVKNLARIAKTTVAGERFREVEIDYSAGSVAFRFSTGEALTVTPADHDFPKWRQLLPDTGETVSVEYAAFNPEKLAKFAKVGSNALFNFRGAGKPAVVTIGSDFIGLIMPVRREDYTWQRPEWIV